MHFSEAQLQVWLQGVLWPLIRISGLMMTAPVFGGHGAPGRVRLLFVVALTLVLAPVLPPVAPLPAFGAAWWLRGAEELLLGIALGFILQITFETVILAGEMIGYGMGLGFAHLNDPVRGADAPVVGEFMNLLVMLLFLSAGGHLRLIQLLAESFQAAPDPAPLLSAQSFRAIAEFGLSLFSGALSVALPLVGALLIVNIAFGFMSRAAPTLNAQSVGFPISIIAGLILLRADLPVLFTGIDVQLREAWDFLGRWLAVAHGG